MLTEIIILEARKKLPEIKLVAGIGRGGIIPAAIIAYQLNLPMIVLSDPHQLNCYEYGSVLVVDDVCDTGQTFDEMYLVDQNNRLQYTAALVRKSWAKFLPDFVGYTSDEWIVWPWER